MAEWPLIGRLLIGGRSNLWEAAAREAGAKALPTGLPLRRHFVR